MTEKIIEGVVVRFGDDVEITDDVIKMAVDFINERRRSPISVYPDKPDGKPKFIRFADKSETSR